MTALRAIAQASAALFSGDAAARALLFVTTVYVARVLGPAPFGLVTFAQALLGYFLLASDWGLATYGVREIARHPEHGRDAWAAIAAVRVVIAVGLVLGAVLVAAAVPSQTVTRQVVLLTLASAIPIAAVPDWTARGFGSMRLAGALVALSPALALALMGPTVRGPESVAAVPAARLAAATLTAVVGAMLLARRADRRPTRVGALAWLRQHGLRSLLGSGGILLLANAAVLAYNSADQLLLKAFLGDRSVGLYGSAYRVIQLPTAGLYAVTASALPILTRLAAERPAEARATTARLTALAAATGAAIAVGLWLAADPLVRLVYGEAYAAAAAPLKVLAFAVPLDFVVSVRGTAYIAAGRERATLACVLTAAVVNVGANLFLIPRYGMMAAAWVTLASYAVLLAAYGLIMEARRS